MAFAPTDLKSEDLLYSFLDEYLDGELPPDILGKIEPMLRSPEYSGLPERFQSLRGKLQLAMQSYYLKEEELGDLAGFVLPPGDKQKVEDTKIEAFSRGLTVNSIYRRAAIGLLIAAGVGASLWKVTHSHDNKFRALEYLGYEAQAMEEDATERLNLPSHDAKEVRQYLESYPGLEFKAKMLRNVPDGWQIQGATVIDYEVAKVAAVMYERVNGRNKEKVFYFNFAGELSDLPAAEPGNMRGLIYQTYASNELNLVAWQSSPGVLSLLVGRRSAPELAEIALASNASKGD